MHDGFTRRNSLLGAAAAAVAGSPALAQDAAAEGWPRKPITFVVAFGPGSGTDIRARIIADRLASAWGQPVVVDNRGGANGFLAAEAVARARPDGYTLLFTSNSTHAANPALFRRLPYDPVADFTPVALIGLTPLIIVVNRDLPIRNLAELVTYSKAHPGRLNYASGNTSSRIGAEMFKIATGADMSYVSYRSNPQAMTDVVSGTAQVMFSDAIVAISQARGGRVRAIGITGKQRIEALPDVPTVEEGMNLPEFDIYSWTAIFAPAGTPAELVRRLNAKVLEIVALPEVRRPMEEEGTQMSSGSPDEVGQFVVSEIAKWRGIVRQAGIEVAP